MCTHYLTFFLLFRFILIYFFLISFLIVISPSIVILLKCPMSKSQPLRVCCTPISIFLSLYNFSCSMILSFFSLLILISSSLNFCNLLSPSISFPLIILFFLHFFLSSFLFHSFLAALFHLFLLFSLN